jgi:hypothetical protein
VIGEPGEECLGMQPDDMGTSMRGVPDREASLQEINRTEILVGLVLRHNLNIVIVVIQRK